jgi:hypothetical protein
LDENFDKGTESKRLLEIAKLMSLMPYEKKWIRWGRICGLKEDRDTDKKLDSL